MSEPWTINPALTFDRLQVVANLLGLVRDQALELHDPGAGEGNWSLGTRVYERSMFTFEQARAANPWLETERRGLYFLFYVSGVPFRFYRADSEDISPKQMKTKSVRASELKRRQMSLFPRTDDDRNWFWRIRVETEESGRALRFVAHRATEDGEISDEYALVNTGTVAALAPVAPPREAVELPPPEVELRSPQAENDDEDKTGDDETRDRGNE